MMSRGSQLCIQADVDVERYPYPAELTKVSV
jgi:hypothetical protein